MVNRVKLRSLGGMHLVVGPGGSWFAGLCPGEICQRVSYHD
jgi:hypothetical protein